MADIDILANTATISAVTCSTTNTTLLSENTNRKMAIFYNRAGRDIYIKFGTTASTTSFTVVVQDNAYYELPLPVYTGRIDAVTSTGSGVMQITEIE